MKYNHLGTSDIEISQICLGTMTWGEQNTEQEAHEQLNYAIEQGINFIDTAEMYPVPPKSETQGQTEIHIGNWLKQRGKRDDLIIASKVAAAAEWLPHLRGGTNKADEKNITQALEDILKRLQTDYLDLFQIHWPERATNYFGKLGYQHVDGKDGVAIEETLAALDKLVKSGKVRQVGISNETAWGIAEYLRVAEAKGYPRIASIQNPYSLLNRSYEVSMAEFSHRGKVGLLAYSPLGFGVLSGKYLNDQKPDKARLTLFTMFTRYTNENSVKATAAYVNLAKESGLDPAQLALAYVNSRPFVDSNIIGATTMEQLKSNIASINLTPNKQVLQAIETIHTQYPNPSP